MRSQAWQDYRKLVKAPDPLAVISDLRSPLDALLKVANADQNKIVLLNNYAMHAFQAKDFAKASALFHDAYRLSRETEALKNAVVTARLAGDEKLGLRLEAQAVDALGDLPRSAEKAELLDALCHLAGNRGDEGKLRQYGQASLDIKDRIAGAPLPLNSRKRPVFDFLRPERNIISFSLFGSLPRYTRLAVENVRACPHVFPGWTCRFYCDDKVPMPVIEELASMGAQVRIMPEPHDERTASGTFWRFWVAADPGVDFFLVRDADCLLSVREKVCVDEWIASETNFHLLRDFHTHSELILAGLWGGVGGLLPTIEQAGLEYQAAIRPTGMGRQNHDQLFLRNHVWPAIKNSLMQHDSVFAGPGTRPFPPYGTIQPMRHVGQDMSIYMKS